MIENNWKTATVCICPLFGCGSKNAMETSFEFAAPLLSENTMTLKKSESWNLAVFAIWRAREYIVIFVQEHITIHAGAETKILFEELGTRMIIMTMRSAF